MRPLLALLGSALAVLSSCGGEPASAPAQVAAEPATQGLAANAIGTIVELSADDQTHMGLELASLEPASWSPERVAYGRIVSDPSRRTTVRAPLAGALLAGDVPLTLGAAVEPGAILFRLAPRWSPQERADLTSRRLAARGELAAAEAEMPTLARTLERARALNAQDKSVSDRELEDAEMRVRIGDARLANARELVRALEAVGTADAAGAVAIRLPSAGIVTDLLATPGETVEAGTPLLVVEDVREPLASIDLPLDGSVPRDVDTARISPYGAPGVVLSAVRVGLSPEAGMAGLSPAVLFRVPAGSSGDAGLRAGLEVLAWLPTGEAEQGGFLVPRSAVVRLAGQAFVYVRRGEDRLERRALAGARSVEKGWLVGEAWTRGEPLEVVVRGAQNVLSFELLGRQGEEED